MKKKLYVDASNTNGLISWKRLEWTYFAKAYGKEVFRKRVWKGLISRKRLGRPYSKQIFEKVCTTDYSNVPK